MVSSASYSRFTSPCLIFSLFSNSSRYNWGIESNAGFSTPSPDPLPTESLIIFTALDALFVPFPVDVEEWGGYILLLLQTFFFFIKVVRSFKLLFLEDPEIYK